MKSLWNLWACAFPLPQNVGRKFNASIISKIIFLIHIKFWHSYLGEQGTNHSSGFGKNELWLALEVLNFLLKHKQRKWKPRVSQDHSYVSLLQSNLACMSACKWEITGHIQKSQQTSVQDRQKCRLFSHTHPSSLCTQSMNVIFLVWEVLIEVHIWHAAQM